MRQFVLLLILSALIWGFWMTWEWLRRPKENKNQDVDILGQLEELKKNNQIKKENEESI